MMNSFENIIQKYRDTSFSQRDKGYRFERLMQAFLKTYPFYSGEFDKVWLWNEFPSRHDFGSGDKDLGVDLVARTKYGDYWAVQCKCYDESARIDKPKVDTFLSTSGKSFYDVIEAGKKVNFTYRLWIDTTLSGFNAEAEATIKNQSPQIGRLGYFDLRNAPVDWIKLDRGILGESAAKKKYAPKPHQQTTIAQVHGYFKWHDRGKLIMACGTGKTFTILRIAKNETGKDGLVLFLVPSIALLGQTLREWKFQSVKPIYPRGKIFGSGSRTPVSITIMVKKLNQTGSTAQIFYKDIGDYLSWEEKLNIIQENNSIFGPSLKMSRLKPNEHGDWLNKRNSKFNEFIPIESENKFDGQSKSFFSTYSLGIATNKDAWLYNFSYTILSDNISKMVSFYNNQRLKYHREVNDQSAKDFVLFASSRITWTAMFLKDLENNVLYRFKKNKLCDALYRPFVKACFLYEKQFIQRTYQQTKLFPSLDTKNLLICTSGIGSTKDFSAIITDVLPDIQLQANGQCFPLYWYEKKQHTQGSLFEKIEDVYIRHDGISDFILEQAQSSSGYRVEKEDVFYYVYGILHSPGYRKTFANDLKKMLPRLPLVEKTADFWSFSKACRELAELHLNYEEQKPPKEVKVTGIDKGNFIVNKMNFPAKCQKATIIYNAYITVSNIPAKAYEYIVNGKPVIEWIMERHAVTVHKESGIKNDPNDWAKEHGNPQYILDLLLSVITVSVKTVDIVEGLPKVEWK